jgi:hypothetical protein
VSFAYFAFAIREIALGFAVVFSGSDSPDGESKLKGITTRIIGVDLNCLRILRKISIDVEVVVINRNKILTPYFSTNP